MSVLDSVGELTTLLERWDKEVNGTTKDPVPILQRIAELVEGETAAWYKVDPDPFDDRHPSRANPTCALGHLLKAVFKHEPFMNKLVSAYLTGNRESVELREVSCRLLLDLLPGLETTIVFQENDELVRKLVTWASGEQQPLASYAIGLLGAAMEIQEIAANFKENNAVLVPTMLKKLHELKSDSERQAQLQESSPEKNSTPVKNGPKMPNRHFASIHANDIVTFKQPDEQGDTAPTTSNGLITETESNNSTNQNIPSPSVSSSPQMKKPKLCDGDAGSQLVKGKFPTMTDLSVGKEHVEDSSCWAEQQPYIIGTYRMCPLDTNMQQRLILQYLTPMGEYQELLTHVFEHKAMDLIFYYIDLKKNEDARLAFEATKYLASLLCHKKFTTEFIQSRGVQSLLQVYRPSVAATGVSMCLYYLAYFEDSMERVCQLPNNILMELVRVVLWLLECSHESGRCHATMFFSLSFSFRIILDMFDQQDGLRKLYNVMGTLDIMNIDDPNPVNQSEDALFTSRQSARHVCVALRRYFEAQLFAKAADIHRTHTRSEGGSPIPEISPYKASKFSPEVIQDNLELLLECLPLRMKWEPITKFLKLGGGNLLLQLIAMAADWSAYTGKAETLRSALDVLAVCAVCPKGMIELCGTVPLPDSITTPAISILLGLAEGEYLPDPDVQKSALSVINNVVCAPLFRNANGTGRVNNGNMSQKKKLGRGDHILSGVWGKVRENNGIMILLKLMMTKTPITEADSIRALACKALVGLCRSETIKQIVSKLPLFNNGQLQMLMREPVLQDKRQEHLKFCRNGVSLIEKVSGKQQNSNIDVSLERLRKADIIAQTKIVYEEKELLHLIQDHLMVKGLYNTATMLQQEAGLPRCTTPPVVHPDNPIVFSTPKSTPRVTRQFSTPIQSSQHTATHTPTASHSITTLTHANQSTPSNQPTTSSKAPMAPLPIRLNVISSKVQTPSNVVQPKTPVSRKLIRQKHDSYNIVSPYALSPALLRHPAVTSENAASLDKIVTEYLRKQHAACQNPVVTCPPFSLLRPHMCPDPKGKSAAPLNVTPRTFRKKYYPPFGGCDGVKSDRKLIYSRFRPTKSFRDSEEDGCFSCCTFSANEQSLILGTYTGELKIINIQNSEELGSYVCHNSPLCHCETTRDGALVVTCSTWGRPLSALWNMNDMFEMKHGFDDDCYMEFSKAVQDKLVGTKDETARVYDVTTGLVTLQLHDENKTNNYLWNRATFNPTDELILNDGVLWDVNSGRSIHKFDKFNPNVSGVFHPNGLEIIINSEVWDIRTFHLLHTVPALDQCQIRFNNTGHIIYGAIHQNDESDMDDERIKSPFGSSFRTFDGADYSNIATIDVKKNIFDLSTDSSDLYIAVVENLRNQETLSEESVCRLYEVGRLKDEEDQDDEDDEAMNDDEAADDDDDEDDDGDDEDFVADDSEQAIDNGSGSDHANSDDDAAIEFEPDSTDSDVYDDDDDDDDDDVLFELSDVSSGPWI